MSSDERPPPGFAPFASVRRPGGRVALFAREDPATLWVVPRGYVGPGLLRAELALAARFGSAHPGGWDYVVDTGAVRVANPLNPIWLRRIHRLPGVSRYLVIAPSLLVRLAARAARRLVRADAIVAHASELMGGRSR
jgi:hypothetical protein